MIKFKDIVTALGIVALMAAMTSCKKENLLDIDPSTQNGTVPEGFTKMAVDMSNLAFNEQQIAMRTRTGDVELVATTREMNLKNMKAYVFDNQTPALENKLIEVQNVVRDYNAAGEPRYYTVLKERTTPVRIIGIANASTEKLEELLGTGSAGGGIIALDEHGQVILKGDASDFTYKDFLYFAQMPYDPSSSSNVLKNSDASLLPIYSESITFDELNSSVLEEWEKTESLVSRFAYARIDVVLNDGKNDVSSSDYTQLLGVSAMEAPVATADPITGEPSSLPRVHTHEVTPLTNLQPTATQYGTLGKLPSSITAANIDSKYIQGLYIYPTAPLANSPADIGDLVEDNKPVYIVVRMNNGAGNERFYKLILRYTRQNYDDGESVDAGETFFIYNSSRYLVNITKVNSPGYLSYDEAAQGPPSNIEYSITVDDQASDIVSNGQYYLGVNKDLFELEMSTYNSNLSETEQNYTVGASNDFSWKVDNVNKVVRVNFSLSYNGGTTNGLMGAHPDDFEVLSKVDPKTLKSEITTSAGVSHLYLDGVAIEVNEKRDSHGDIIYDAEGNIVYEQTTTNIVGASNPDLAAGDVVGDWVDYFGTHNFEVTIPFDVYESHLTVKVGELTRKVVFNVNKTMITDYSNQSFINKLLTGDETRLPQSSQANSYIINPFAGVKNEYYIPVVARINEFWSSYAQNRRYDVITTNDWSGDDQFSVELSWYDGESMAPYTISKSQSPAGENAIKIEFDGQSVVNKHQNFAVNVKKGNEVIWTWHLWVTDYNPYITDAGARPVAGNNDFHSVKVMNGDIHRYGESKWQNELAGRAMMDRNLGALNTSFAGGDSGAGAGSLYYQYGRKDPFPGVSAKFSNGSAVVNSLGYDTTPTVNTFEDAVVAPTKLVLGATTSGKNWCLQVDILQYLWHDFKASTTNLRKSIFDPSPLGWMVAPGIAFTHLDYNGHEPLAGDYQWVAHTTPGLEHSYSSGGAKTFETYFPAAGMISAVSGGKLENETDGLSQWNTYLWTSEPSAATTGSSIDQAKSFVAAQKIRIYPWGPTIAIESDKPALAPASRGNALPVRSIQEGVY